MKKDINDIASFAKRKGFVYPSSEIYGGYGGFYDYGPLGVELKNNIKNAWWKFFVQQREYIVGLDSSIIGHPMIWKASGHTDNFGDVIVKCEKCGAVYRGDHLIEDKLEIQADGMGPEQISKLIEEHNIKCEKCQGNLSKASDFNLMFTTEVGAAKHSNSTSYLRPETAQMIFTNFKLVYENARVKLPFGILQIGKAFRNEISPRNFLFRLREFEQMEIEFFMHPEKINDCPFYNQIKDIELNVLTEEMQKSNEEHKLMKIYELVEKGNIKSKWHAYFLAEVFRFFTSYGINAENLRLREHLKEELSHYSAGTFDFEYRFSFGWKEVHGMANRTDFDLSQHIKFSKKDLSVFDEETKKKVVPHVIEPSQGLDRAFLLFLYEAYAYDEKRQNYVLKLDSRLAPMKAGIFPLVNKPELIDLARNIFEELVQEFPVVYDKSGSIGRRYARQDEQGTPFCITVDFDGLENNTVTIRDRDTAEQKRINVAELRDALRKLINKELSFKDI